MLMDRYIVTRNEQTCRQMHLHRGVYPVWYPEPRGIQAAQWQTDVGPAAKGLCSWLTF